MFTDIHCHLLPEIDDGSSSLPESLAMARMAVADGVETVVVTPHQLGSFGKNRGDEIRRRTRELQTALEQAAIPLKLLPGADVRIEDSMLERIRSGDVLSLGDRGKHVLLELPHELYFPMEPVLEGLRSMGMVGVLSHPERNEGILRDPRIAARLVDLGCLMQVTTGSLTGTFGPDCQTMAEGMLAEGLVHFIATDAHGIHRRRPRFLSAFDRVADLVGADVGEMICCELPAAVAAGVETPVGRLPARRPRRRWFQRQFAG
jgi:protein-tyrosine phosphatase